MIIERLIAWMEIAPLEKRVMAADALVRAWQMPSLGDEERDAAEAAMTCILDDNDCEVRLSLATALADSPNPPRHLIIALAAEEGEISLPILAHCSGLLDVELAHYISTGSNEQQIAIASRPHLMPKVTKLIAAQGCLEACLELVINPDARISTDDFYTIAERHGTDDDLRRCLLARHDIGMRARVLLIEIYAASLVDHSIESDEKSVLRSSKELQEVCDKATITFAAQIADEEITDVVIALIERKKLTTAFLLRAICMGNLSLFAHSLAVLSGQPMPRVERILKDNRANAMHALYTKAGLPLTALSVFSSAIITWRKYLNLSDGNDPDRLPYLVTKEVIANYEGARDQIVEELLMLLRKICTETARDNARSKVEQMVLESESANALPAPEADVQSESEPETEMDQEELIAFAVQFADELADLTLQDERAIAEAAADLVAANQDPEVNNGYDSVFENALDLTAADAAPASLVERAA